MEMIRLFDIRTIFLMLPITAILFGLVLWLGPKRDRNEGLQRWIIGLVCVGVSWSLMATRGHLHPAISVAFADGLMVAALSAQAGAFYEFKYQRPPSRKTLIPAVVLFLIFLTIPLSYRTYTLLGSFTISVPLLIMGYLSWGLGNTAARIPMAVFYTLGGFLLQARALHIWFSTETNLNFFTAHPLHVFTFLNSFAMTISGSIGFLELQRWRAEKRIRHYAMHDDLTGLLNRRAFFKLAQRELGRAKQKHSAMAVMMLDIDHFKRINDTYGHFTGDIVLVEIANAFHQCLREVDLLCRSGGEEFMVLLVGVSQESALEIAERICDSVSKLKIKGVEHAITLSIGLTMCDASSDESIDKGLQKADEALYEAKRGGRNRVVVAEAAQQHSPA
ncbi:GGDEF domain-containing protein [Zhongshania sp.]|jgi:diguanylate cyclase (GGDEF)-like protein|uniref:GGDEF domain-containing protein n=1 Tax=Zhongshania sp. TaxID=1971902 RepID=UPI001B638CF8|nr:GGDEF domain-containing protein [Zhongshania sp.]MBQ0794950.1 GGDEF domain-containing protein [Zhongshania sp.]